MKAIRIIALFTAALLLAGVLGGCRNAREIEENLQLVTAAIEKARGIELGEIMVYETRKAEKDIDPHTVSSTTETYIKYARSDVLEYDLTSTVTLTETEESYTYMVLQERDKLTQQYKGQVISNDEMTPPDIFAAFQVGYTPEQVENVELIETPIKNLTLYTFTMCGEYVDQFDKTLEDGSVYDCVSVVYNYYLDAEGYARTVVDEFTYTLTSGGESQKVIHFTQTGIE